jgi:hypothetical protein
MEEEMMRERERGRGREGEREKRAVDCEREFERMHFKWKS